MSPQDDDRVTEELMRRSSLGDDSARQQLLTQHRNRLKKMVTVRMDSRLSARFDPSDVVQEAMIVASRRLDRYLAERPLPLYSWLRAIAWERLCDLHQHHMNTQKRAVTRETHTSLMLSDQSVMELVGRVASYGSSPSQHVVREERRQRVRKSLEQLGEHDREVLVLRFLEGMSVNEVASVVGINPDTVQMRQFRALDRLRRCLEQSDGDL